MSCIANYFNAFFYLTVNVQALQAQSISIKGVVIASDDYQPLAGVTVQLKSLGKRTVTDTMGRYSLTVTPTDAAKDVLLFTYVGFSKLETKINNRTNINVQLQRNVDGLQEVVVTNSYSRPKRKEEVVGSIVTLSDKDLQANRPIETLDKLLEGLAAGVQVQPNTELGTPVRINIRGQNSLSSLSLSNDAAQLTTSTQPLFVVDGVPILEPQRGDIPSLITNQQLLNPLASINPDDIESISILKDAAATSIYGNNASNGVIIITTKKGRAGRTKVNFGYNAGQSRSINRIKWLSGPEYYTLLYEMYINEGRSPFDAERLAGSRDINTNWFELTNRVANFQNADFDISGGNENTTFRFSASYLQQQAIQLGNDYNRVNLNLRVDHKLSKRLSATINFAPSFLTKNGLNAYSSVPIAPNVPVFNADGSYYAFSNLGVPNPIAILNQNVNQHEGGALNGNLRLDYKLFDNLTISTSIGTNSSVNKQNVFFSPRNATGSPSNGRAIIYDRQDFSWISFTQVNYVPKFKNQLHKLDMVGGFEARHQSAKLLTGQGTGFTYYRLNELSNAATRNAASSININRTTSFYGQAGYSFADKYFVTLSSRLDAASVFGASVNSTVNSAIGGGWVLSKESFFPKWKAITSARIRASYGTTGNSRIGSYEARGLYTFNNEGYNGNASSALRSAPNPNLGWERSYKTNLGLDITLAKRFTITLDVYQNIVDDAISSINVPAENGFTSVLANIAKMRNRGWDAAINAQILTGAFTWNSTLNVGNNRSTILSVKNDFQRYSSTQAATVLRTGVSTTAIWGFQFAGVDPQTGYEMYVDDGKVVRADSLDRSIANGVYLGDRLPKAQGGFINNFSYKGFTLTVNILYSFGGKFLMDYNLENNGRNLQNSNMSVNLLDRWQRTGDITDMPRLRLIGNPLVPASSKYIFNDDYLKLSNISLAYVLPAQWLKKLKNNRITVFGNVTNIAYIYFDKSPAGRNGIREYKFRFPEAQTWTAGLRWSM
ncbi:MAG TPA: hypothetical protein DCL43_09510 [Chitinophagaceae bacterium]|nr:hypothetical protein [Chitinophagaceae bacterium]